MPESFPIELRGDISKNDECKFTGLYQIPNEFDVVVTTPSEKEVKRVNRKSRISPLERNWDTGIVLEDRYFLMLSKANLFDLSSLNNEYLVKLRNSENVVIGEFVVGRTKPCIGSVHIFEKQNGWGGGESAATRINFKLFVFLDGSSNLVIATNVSTESKVFLFSASKHTEILEKIVLRRIEQ